ncbi:accessory Sec-dependent serine-rich glycoprotein adhesin, partial [Streptococcus halichoeri]|uniref:accessory Sec-dependent serine-rich glycoprotein adhesin n=1 Tax=Streptococcus halichoeri TaxID=254785 RepID=UPI001356D586
MLKKNYHYQEASRKTRVKMHKSGKHWVRTVISSIGLLRFFKGASPKDVHIQEVETELASHSPAISLLKGIAASGAMLGGALVMSDQVLAEEVTQESVQPLATTDTLTMETGTDHSTLAAQTAEPTTQVSSELSESSSLSQSQSLSSSESTSASQAALASESAANDKVVVRPRAVRSVSEQPDMEPVPLADMAEAETVAKPEALMTEGKDVTAQLQDVQITLQERSTTPGTVNMDRGEGLTANLSFTAQSVSPGDTFKVKLSDKLDAHGISTEMLYFPINNQNGELIASGTYDESEHSITYKFTKIVSMGAKVTASVDLSLFIDDQNTPKTTENVKISVGLGSKTYEKTVTVKYEPPAQYQNYNIDSRIVKTNFDNFTFKHVTQINPLGTSIYSYYGKLVSVIESADSRSHIDFSKVDLKVYRVRDGHSLTESMNENYENTLNFTDITSSLTIEDRANKSSKVIHWNTNYMTHKYVVVAMGKAESDSKTIKILINLKPEHNYNTGVTYTTEVILYGNSGKGKADSTSLSQSTSASQSASTSSSLSASTSTRMSESASASSSLSASTSASLSASESASASSSLSASTSASLSNSESASASSSLSASTSASLSASESASTSSSLSASTSASLSASESASTSSSLSASTSTSTSASESASTSSSLSASTSASLSASESASTSSSLSASTSASTSASESASTSSSLSASTSGSTSASESASTSSS